MKLYLKTRDFSVSQEEFELLRDGNKELLYTHPVPKNLDKYYDSEDYISHTDANNTLFDGLYQLAKRYSLSKKERYARKYCRKKKSLLDMGSGTGDFLLYATKKNWQVAGIEPNERAAKRSAAKGIRVYPTLQALQGRSFQIITLWHVLEHLPDLEASINGIERLLEDDGTLIVAVPNFKSFDANYYGPYWAAYDVPRHVWHFSRRAIQKLFHNHGFRLIKTKPMWLDAYYVGILSERYRGSRWPFLRGIWMGCRSNANALVSKECSSHIYILQKAKNSF